MFALSMAVDPGDMLDEVLRKHLMTHDEAWRQMGFKTAAAFHKAVIAKTHPLCARRLQRLPWRIKAAFWSLFIADAATDFGDELRADRKRMATAELRPHDKKAGAA